MLYRVAAVGAALALAAMAGQKKPGAGTTGNDLVEIYATAYPEGDLIKPLLGSDLGGHYIVLEVKVAPKYGKEITVSHDDFLLRTDRDGDKSTPFEPSQIAGRGVLVISQNGAATGGGIQMGGPPMGPVYGPPMGGPMGYPGPVDTGAGADTGPVGTGPVKMQKAGVAAKANPLEKVLQQKMLPEKKTTEPVSGLLYFPMEKQKLKDLELIYTTPEGKLRIRFREEK